MFDFSGSRFVLRCLLVRDFGDNICEEGRVEGLGRGRSKLFGRYL